SLHGNAGFPFAAPPAPIGQEAHTVKQGETEPERLNNAQDGREPWIADRVPLQPVHRVQVKPDFRSQLRDCEPCFVPQLVDGLAYRPHCSASWCVSWGVTQPRRDRVNRNGKTDKVDLSKFFVVSVHYGREV